MKELFYEIVAEAPLAVNERKPGGNQYQEGLSHIPGRLVRGALATEVLRGCQDPTHERNHAGCPQPSLCRALFGNELHFEDAFPLKRKNDGPLLLPTTAISCKDNSGFIPRKPIAWKNWDAEKRSKYEPKHHGVFDTLIDRACWELLRPAAMQYAPRCPMCGGRTKAWNGAYSRLWVEEEGQQVLYYFHETVSRELLTRVAINRRRGVAENELLYAINALSQFVPIESNDSCQETQFENSRYVGSVRLSDDGLAMAVSDQLRRVFRLGGGSSRGLGRVQVAVIATPARPTVAERLERFNDMLAERWKLTSRLAGGETTSQHAYFTVTLQSDAVLSADGWQPDVRLSEATVWRACGESGQPPADLRLMRSYTTPVTRGGFQSAWGLPKMTDLAVQAGGVYLYQVAALDGWAQRLERLETQGIGNRRAEGFGRVRVCDPFHYEAVKEAK